MHDVFISYSHKDVQVADAICHRLEEKGIRCWYAPRNIAPGAEWADSIVKAIDGTSLMVLVFTDWSNQSFQVRREVDYAVNACKPIIPFKYTDTMPTGPMVYYLSTLHWLDAVNTPLEKAIDDLAGRVESMIAGDGAEAPAAPVEEPPAVAAEAEKKESNRLPLIAGIAAAVLAAAVGIPMLMGGGKAQQGSAEVQQTEPAEASTDTEEKAEAESPAADVAPAPGDENAPDNYLYTVQSDGTVRLDRYMGPETAELIIPTTIDGAPVESIGEKCFEDAEWIEKLVLPEGLVHILYRSFYGCTNLKEMNIPASLKHISGWAFAHTGLVEVVLPDTFESLDYGAFCYCSDLVRVVLPKAVDNLGENTFHGCSALESVTIPAPEPELDAKAFDAESDVTIIGVPGSYTEKYAQGMDLKFEAYSE